MLKGFTKKKVNSLTLGEQLKNLRSEIRVTLHEVSRETKIPVKYLTMIEEGEYERLPPDVYVKGFLKKYAEYIGADAKKLIAFYVRDKDIKNNLGMNGVENNTPKKSRVSNFVVTPKMITVAFVVLVAVGGFFYLYREIGRFAALPRLVVAEPLGDTAVDSDSIVISGYTDQDAKLSINDQPVLVSDKGEFRENIILQQGINTVVVSSVNNFGKTATRTLNIKSNFEKSEIGISENGEVAGLSDEAQEGFRAGIEVAVRIADAPTWLSIESDGGLVYSGTMLSGSTQKFHAEKEIRVTSGKANQTFVRVNEGDEKVLADNPGIVRDVVFAPNN